MNDDALKRQRDQAIEYDQHKHSIHLQEMMNEYLNQMKNWAHYYITETTSDFTFWVKVLGCSCLETFNNNLNMIGEGYRAKRNCRKCYGTGMIPLFDPALFELSDLKAVEALKQVHAALSR